MAQHRAPFTAFRQPISAEALAAPHLLNQFLRRKIMNAVYMISSASNCTTTTLESQKMLVGSRLLKNRTSPSQSYLSYSYSLRIFQNAYRAKISSNSPITVEQEKVEQFRILLRNNGLSDSQMSKVNPTLYKYHPQKIILPKLEFLRSIGVSNDDLQNIIFKNPHLFMRSLENHLIPCVSFFKSIPLANAEIVKLMCRSTRLFNTKLEKIASNVDALKEIGVPHSFIVLVIMHHSSLVLANCNKMKLSINEVLNLGFDPSKMVFVQAVHVLCMFRKEAWESRKKVYSKFGLSESDIQLAFRAHPLCMSLSEEKIERAMEFFVNEMGFPVSMIVQSPAALFYNFEKRIVPRCRVIKVLEEKGLLKKPSLMYFLSKTNEQFLVNYVLKYEDVLPGELKDVYSEGLISKHG